MTGPLTRGLTARTFITLGVWLAGGRTQQLAPGRDPGERAWHAVILSGGTDLHPDGYAGAPVPGVRYDSDRDSYEREILEDAIDRNLPVLGICRGAQLLNVALGGSLHQDVRALRRLTSNRPTPFAVKTLRVHRGTRLGEVLGTDTTRINSLHRQGIDRLGRGLEVAGHDLDDIVQAVEHASHPWCFGVQWHPEYLPYLRAHRRLFRALVEAARLRAEP